MPGLKISPARRRKLFPLLVVLSSVLFLIPPLSVVTPTSAQTSTLSGWFTVIWGDPEPGSGHPGETLYWLRDESGVRTQLFLDGETLRAGGGILALHQRRVTIVGDTILPFVGGETAIRVRQVRSKSASPQMAVLGPQPWVSIACKFKDVADEPEDLSYLQNMYSSTEPGLDHYWREQSYDLVNLNGSTAVGWFVLPKSKSYYVYDRNGDSYPDLDYERAANDCTALADAAVNFNNFVGINLMFNADLGCCAYGGVHHLSLDGTNKYWRMTWEPPWGYRNIAIIAHETGHGFGLPHSSGNYGQTYDNVWDVMSDTWSNCSRAEDPSYGCVGQHTISAHKEHLGWITNARKFIPPMGSVTTITLEQLALPQTDTFRMARIPIQGSNSRFYTVEARRRTGYDTALPDAAVIIHRVDLEANIWARVLDIDNNGDTGDAGAMWLPGETFRDEDNGIEVCVNSSLATGFRVTVALGAAANCSVVTPTVTPTLCAGKPSKPHVLAPEMGETLTKLKVRVDWEDAACAANYVLLLRRDSKKGPTVQTKTVYKSRTKTQTLEPGVVYYVRIKACSSAGECSKSKWSYFGVLP